jgi:hypothetical protein
MDSEGVSRRRLVQSALGMATASVWGSAALADALKPNESKAASWILGDKLSLAAVAYGRNLKQDMIDGLLKDAKAIADILGVSLKPFPSKAGTESATLATMIHYLIKGDGWSIGSAIASKYDRVHGILF